MDDANKKIKKMNDLDLIYEWATVLNRFNFDNPNVCKYEDTLINEILKRMKKRERTMNAQLKRQFRFRIELQAKYDFCLEHIPLRDEDICLETNVEKRLQMIGNLSKAMYILGMLQGYEQMLCDKENEFEQFKKTEEAKNYYRQCYNETKEDFEEDGEIWF